MARTMLLVNRADTMQLEHEEPYISELSFHEGLAEIEIFFPHPSSGCDDGTSSDTLDSSPYTILTPSSGDSPSEYSNYQGTPGSIFRHFHYFVTPRQDDSVEQRTNSTLRQAEHMSPTSSGQGEESPPLLPIEQLTTASLAMDRLNAGPLSSNHYGLFINPTRIQHGDLDVAVPDRVPWMDESGSYEEAAFETEAPSVPQIQHYQAMPPPDVHGMPNSTFFGPIEPTFTAEPYHRAPHDFTLQYPQDIPITYNTHQTQSWPLGMA